MRRSVPFVFRTSGLAVGQVTFLIDFARAEVGMNRRGSQAFRVSWTSYARVVLVRDDTVALCLVQMRCPMVTALRKSKKTVAD